jgi:hypothetical protein
MRNIDNIVTSNIQKCFTFFLIQPKGKIKNCEKKSYEKQKCVAPDGQVMGKSKDDNEIRVKCRKE